MFKDEWLRMPKYSWVRKAVKCTEFRCQICETTCKLSDLGYAALDSHARGQKHKTKEQSKEQTKNFFSPPKSQASNFQASSASSSQASTSSSSPPSYYSEKWRRNAEVIWCLYCIKNNISDHSNDEIAVTLKAMFPGSQELKIKKDKTKYIRNFGLASHFKSMLT